ncbi:MAG: hypothetical protein Q9183_001648 [Haloplaca sp. 2 TL-2023]
MRQLETWRPPLCSTLPEPQIFPSLWENTFQVTVFRERSEPPTSNVRNLVARSNKFLLTELGNYKPSLNSNHTVCIQPSQRRSSGSHVDLTIEEQQTHAKYQYAGAQHSSGACALIYNPSTKTFLLDRLDVDFTFNLQTTPANKKRKDVTSQYPQLDIGVSDNESDDGRATALPSGDAEHAQADANNPYDYRHFLKRQRTCSPEAPVSRPSASPAPPPRRPSRSKPKSKPKPRPHPQQRSKKPVEETKADKGEDSDDGELIIEMGDSPKPRRFGNGAVVFNHDRRNGPVSLRSAASSMSPASIHHHSGNEDGESDRDVEQFSLPSPAGRPPVSDDNNEDGKDDDGDDEDDGLAEDLMQVMESQDDEDEVAIEADAAKENQTIRRTVEESSSESEEE